MSLIELDLRTARPRQVSLSKRSKSTSDLIFEPSYPYQLLPTAWAAVCRDPSHSRKWEADKAYIEGQGVPAYALAACDALQHTLAEHPEEPTREFDLTWGELMAPADAEPTPLLAPHVPWPRRAAEATWQFVRDVGENLASIFRPSTW